MTGSKLSMAISTFGRMATNLVIFIIMARFLGPEQLGTISIVLAYSALTSLFAEYGLRNFALRNAALEPASSATIMLKTLRAMTLTTAVVTSISLFVLIFSKFSLELSAASVFLYLSTFIAMFCDVTFLLARINRVYWPEAKVVLIAAILTVGLVGPTAFWTGQIFQVAAAVLAARLLYAILTLWAMSPLYRKSDLRGATDFSVRDLLTKSTSYAADGIVTNASNQVDVLVLSSVLNTPQIGVYQAGARIVQAISPVAAILATSYLPELARNSIAQSKDHRPLARMLTLEFCGIAAILYILFRTLGPVYSIYLLGPEYADLLELWKWFALLTLVKFTTSPLSVIMMSRGQVWPRVIIVLLTTFISVFAIYTGVTENNLVLAPILLSVSATVGFMSLLALSVRDKTANIYSSLQLLIVASGWLLTVAF